MTDSEIRVYSKENIDALNWPNNAWSSSIRNIILPFMQQGSAHFIDNIHVTIQLLHLDDLVLPIAICEPGKENSYVCSPYCHYVTYGKEMIAGIKNNVVKATLGMFMDLFGKLLEFSLIDKVVYVNNWLISTNLYPALTRDQIERITQKLIVLFPEHALAFRSLNPFYPKGFLETFKQLGYSMILSRMVYMTDATEDAPFKSRMFKSDLKIFNATTYGVCQDKEILENSISRIKKLYWSLNIKKYSKCNPQYNDNFVRLALQTGWMKFYAFNKDGHTDAVYGYFSEDNVMTSPFFGYDLSIPQETGLYRLLSTHLLLQARENKMQLHQSSGAGHYKKLRRAQESCEYTAVYCKHLSVIRRFSWKLIEKVMSHFGRKFMEDTDD